MDNNSENIMETTKSLPNVRALSSKSALINRFLKNVTLKKMLDIKSHGNLKRTRNYLGLYPKGYKFQSNSNQDIDIAIDKEVIYGKEKQTIMKPVDKMMAINLKKQIFMNKTEQLLRVSKIC